MFQPRMKSGFAPFQKNNNKKHPIFVFMIHVVFLSKPNNNGVIETKGHF